MQERERERERDDKDDKEERERWLRRIARERQRDDKEEREREVGSRKAALLGGGSSPNADMPLVYSTAPA